MKKSILINGKKFDIEIKKVDAHKSEFVFNEKLYQFESLGGDENHQVLQSKDTNYKVNYANSSKLPSLKYFSYGGTELEIELPNNSRVRKKTDDEGHMLSPMPGKVIKVLKSKGDKITKGEPVLILEAMKMEHTIKANGDGVIEKIHFKEGDLVDGQVELVEIKSDKK